MAEKRLATYVQVSDPHFGDLDPAKGNAVLEADAKDWWKIHDIFDGYLGHHHSACVHLADFVQQMETDEGAELLITGDLTAVGKPTQFALAREYFESFYRLADGTPIGLNMAGALQKAIPGNHDHWPGSRQIVGTPPANGLDSTFFLSPFLPTQIHRKKLKDGCHLIIGFINTDADVSSKSLDRLLARGKFSSQISLLESQLGPKQNDEIRVLLLHHSPLYKHSLGLMEIDRVSHVALDAFILRCDITILLTGHVHIPQGGIYHVTHNGRPWPVMETRCGSSLQRDEAPNSWGISSQQSARRFAPNSLLVHRIFEVGGGLVEWRTTLHVRTNRGFRNLGPLAGTNSIVVWPR